MRLNNQGLLGLVLPKQVVWLVREILWELDCIAPKHPLEIFVHLISSHMSKLLLFAAWLMSGVRLTM